MKKFLSIFTVLLGIAMTSQAFADERIDRINNDTIVQANLDAVVQKFNSTCVIGDATFQWRCLNGPGCGYTMTVTCPAQIGGIVIKFDGFDNGTSNFIDKISFSYLR